MSATRLRALIVAAAGAALLAPAPARAAVAIKADPGIRPRFDQSVPDYVVRCDPAAPVRFAVSASGGDSVAVGNRAKQSGDFTADASLVPGQAVELRVATAAGSSTHHVRCLPADFPAWTVRRYRRPQAPFYVLPPGGGD